VGGIYRPLAGAQRDGLRAVLIAGYDDAGGHGSRGALPEERGSPWETASVRRKRVLYRGLKDEVPLGAEVTLPRWPWR